MKKIVLTKLNRHIAGVAYEQWENDEKKEKACDVCLFSEENPSLVGNIYIGHVRDVVKNIEASFVELSPDVLGYLPLKQIQPVFTGRKNTEKICEGDNLLVQVVKDANKTKDAMLTTAFSLTGRFAVLTHGKSGIQFSMKIRDENYKKEIGQKLRVDLQESEPDCNYSLIVRTEAYHAEYQEILEEIHALQVQYHKLIELAMTRQKYYVLRRADHPIAGFVRKALSERKECEIITDDSGIYEELQADALTDSYPDLSIRFYEDALLPLYKLYSLESLFEEIHARKVWLKSGAYLIIDYTEAMTVIDVNTGKCESGKSKERTFLKINKEAALEIARQMRIRNLSGIIIVDFIDMKEEANVRELLDFTRQILRRDHVKTAAVDITRLHLMEITRQKTSDKIPYVDGLFEKKKKA